MPTIEYTLFGKLHVPDGTAVNGNLLRLPDGQTVTVDAFLCRGGDGAVTALSPEEESACPAQIEPDALSFEYGDDIAVIGDPEND